MSNEIIIEDSGAEEIQISFPTTIVGGAVMIADFVADITMIVTGQLVTFTDLTDKSPTLWFWDFGDGTTSTLQNPTHTYTVVGTYTVTLAAANATKSDFETKVGYITSLYDPSSLALFARASVDPDTDRKGLINDLIVGLKADSIWDELDALWFLAAHDQQFSRLNWKANEFNLTEVNSPTWTLDRGYTGDGVSKHLDTNFKMGTNGVNVVQNSNSFGSYSRTNVTNSFLDLGVHQAPFSSYHYPRLSVGAGMSSRINGSLATNSVVADSLGLSVSFRSDSTTVGQYKNGVSLGTASDTSTTLPDLNCYILAINSNGAQSSASPRQLSLIFYGSSSINQLDLYNRIQTYLTGLGANV